MNETHPPRPGALTFGAVTASIAFVMELTLLPLLLSAIQSDLSLSVAGLAWVYNSYATAVAIAVLGAGLMGDRIDKRKLFMFGAALFALGSTLSALSSDLTPLILSRILQGLGGGLFFPLVPVLLTQAYAERSGRILMIWGGLVGFVAAVLPLLGGTLLAAFGWPAIFLSFAAVSTMGLVVLSFGEAQGVADTVWHKPNYARLRFIPGYWWLLAYIALTYGCFSYYLFHFPVTWHDTGFSGQAVSLFLTSVWLSFSLANFLLRDRMIGRGLSSSLLVAPALLLVSFVLAAIDQGSSPLQLLSAVCSGLGLACCNSPSTYLLLRLSPEDLRAISSCLDIIFARFGSVVTITFLAVLSPLPALLALAAVTLLAIVAARGFLKAIPSEHVRFDENAPDQS